MDQKDINKRIFETMGKFKQRLDELEKQVANIDKDTKWAVSRLLDLKRDVDRINEKLADILAIGEYKMSNCAYLVDGECTVWKRGDKPLTSKIVCAVCLSYRKR